MKILKANNYYSIDCDAVPDNKVKSVTGHYTALAYSEETADTQDITVVSNVRTAELSTLPVFSSSELNTTSDTFTDVFMDLDNTGYDDEGFNYYWNNWISESIMCTVDFELTDDLPLAFISARLSDYSGHKRTRTSSSGVYTSLGWLSDFDINNINNKIQTVKNFNKSGFPSTKDNTESLDTFSIKSTKVDPVKDGTKLINGKYVLKVSIRVQVYKGYQEGRYDVDESDPGNPKIINVYGIVINQWLTKFGIEITYGKYNVKEVAFNYTEPDTTQTEVEKYPLNIEGNMYTSDKTTYHANNKITPWWQFISSQIVDEFKNGRLWLRAKIKAKWLIDNNITINSEVSIKDINNNYICRRSGTFESIYVFGVKNIEYVYESGTFYANVILLEKRAEYLSYVITSNNIKVVDSNNIKVMMKGEL